MHSPNSPVSEQNCDSSSLHDPVAEEYKQKKRQRLKRLIAYYNESLLDYDDWSQQRHMHFGFSQSPKQWLRLESMLNAMTDEVLRRLHSTQLPFQQVVDLGCGLGASCRQGASRYPETQFHGVSIVPAQIEYAQRLQVNPQPNRRKGLPVRYLCADYTALPVEDACFDGAYAIESSCYANGLSKLDFLEEAYRILKPGGRLVVADGFLKNASTLGPRMQAMHQRVCQAWAFETR